MNNINYWKPCPFCGSSAILVQEDIRGYSGEKEVYVRCCSTTCGATVPGGHYLTLHNSESEAIEKALKAWNSRTNDEVNNAEKFDTYVYGVLDAARKAILARYRLDNGE